MAIIKCPVCETDIDLCINGSIPSYWDFWQAAISTVKNDRQ